MRLGIIGTGRIAGRFAKETAYVDGVTLAAVYNPHSGSAERFVKEFGSFGKHVEKAQPVAVEDSERFYPLVDAVYIATPHEMHYSYIMEALQQNKHVLCEKPLCLKRSEAEHAYGYAKEHGLVLYEAVKTAYCPGFTQLLETAKSGVIGDVRNVEACFTKLEKTDSRELTDLQFGGSFTELGSYVLLPAIKLFGTTYESLHFDSVYNEVGLDLFTRATMTFPTGMATLTCGLGVKSEGRLLISGTKGYLLVEAPWWKTNCFEARFEDATLVKEYKNEFLGDGLRYELQDFLAAIEQNEPMPSKLSSDESVVFASIMETFLSSASR